MKLENKTLKAMFMTAALTGAGSETMASTDMNFVQNPAADGKTETISFHGATGCEAMASTNGYIEIACFGNPYHGDPNPGMVISLDLNAEELTVSNRYEITPDGQLSEHEVKEQTYALSMTNDIDAINRQLTEADFQMPSLLEMGDAYRNTDEETGLFKMQSDQSNLSVTIYDPGRVSESYMILEYQNPEDGSHTRMMANARQVFVQKTQPEQSPAMTVVDLKHNFSKADFRHTPAKPAGPG